LSLEAAGLEVCDLVLGPVDGQACLAAHLEEAAERLRVMQDELGALQSLTSQARGPVLGGSDEVPPLAVALSPSSSPKLIETRVNAAANNRI
jgi:hypothetical protein